MGLKIVIPAGYQRVKKISLTAMPLRGAGAVKLTAGGHLTKTQTEALIYSL
jgi:hypothetical protein